MPSPLTKLITSREFQLSVSGVLTRKIIQRMGRVFDYSPEFLVASQATERPHYAYCLLTAARLAQRLGIDRISALEFGVAGGNGLAYMFEFSKKIKKRLGVQIDCYGFDTGKGMPDPQGPKDLPYWFKANQYKMDQDALRRRLPEAHLVIGEIAETARSFIDTRDPAPIGVVMNDADYYYSTLASFALFDAAASRPDKFLPRLPMYFDDITGGDLEMYGPFNGEMAAVADFNEAHPDIKIHLNQNLISAPHIRYRHTIYYAHLFAHPRYGDYVGGAEQEWIEAALRLRP